ncbi:MAG: DUF721 domain-containing protein [Betaproteobacteria bacterium]|nr:DUF721 domain-containing protein [Betaproteobacteria bacterium]
MAKSASNFTPAKRPEVRPTARDPLAYLRSDDTLAALLPTAQQVAELQAACETLLPTLFGRCQVLHLRQGILTIAAPNAALATRLRQIQPKLQQDLQGRGWDVEQIRMKIQLMSAEPAPVPPGEPRELSSSALSSFAALASEIEDSPLRDAVQALLRRRNKA